MTRPDANSLLDAIESLAIEIARLSPDCAEKATRLVELARELRSASLDRGAVQDAISSAALGSDLTDGQVHTTTEAVLKVAREER